MAYLEQQSQTGTQIPLHWHVDVISLQTKVRLRLFRGAKRNTWKTWNSYVSPHCSLRSPLTVYIITGWDSLAGTHIASLSIMLLVMEATDFVKHFN